ncbi:hypothetical protein [Kibdelosporangium phytohabitans]|uniref:Uncharacterized protein n=1 Tax=Kibdelosporangium phytohabitans TaxID=860235 RepID=A0A0N9HNB4_9PSEU|nr:hypothetical protein [Kibdelosporangium phytohabitans]ALG05598.1 hypothetical protein AOZ06_00435 [Kibdelosporangium phytohabitans]MBE1466436.1 hypothetical protein [Kibdelosporangium phytohabitans]
MGWQDELQSLDEQLSAGQIRAEEYRKRRDELLAAASSGAISLRRVHRQKSPSIANAFSAETKPDTSRSADVTQKVPAGAWQTARPQTPPPPPPPMQASAPPPASPPPPPPASTSTALVPMHGSEVFGNKPSKPGTRESAKVPKFLVAVVVLALVAGGVWWFAFRGGDGSPNTGGVQPDAAPPAATSGELTLDKLPNPTDSQLSTAGVLTVDQAQTNNLIRPDEAAYLSATDLQKIYFRTIVTGNLSYQLFAFQTQTDTGGTRIVSGALERGKRANMVPATIDGLPANVTVTKILVAGAAYYEAVYPIDKGAVRLVVLQSGPNNERQLVNAMKRTAELATASIKPK